MKSIIYILMLFLLLMSVAAAPDFDLKYVSHDDDLAPGEQGSIKLEIENKGTTGTMKVECGLYTADTVSQWYSGGLPGFFFNPFSDFEIVENCVEGERNVQTAEILLEVGDSASGLTAVTFRPYLPGQANEDQTWVYHCQAFRYCWDIVKDTTRDVGMTDSGIKYVDVVGLPTEAESCFDNTLNQDETYIDCGGSCRPCQDGVNCNTGSDCQSGFCAFYERCESTGDADNNGNTDDDNDNDGQTDNDKDGDGKEDTPILTWVLIITAILLVVVAIAVLAIGGK